MFNAVYNIAGRALSNAQVGINVTSNNVANSSVEGYSRRTVSYESSLTIQTAQGAVGTGAEVQAIKREFDQSVEKLYLTDNAGQSMWNTIADTLSTVETLFTDSGDSTTYGLSTSLSTLLTSFSSLSAEPDSDAARTELLGYAQTLAEQLNTTDASLAAQQQDINDQLQAQVDAINDSLSHLADLNASIASTGDASALQDDQAQTLRDLSSYLGIQVMYRDDGQVAVLTAAGQPLVEGNKTYSLALEGAQASASLAADSTFGGSIYFEGESASQLTIDMLTAGPADGSATAATFRVSTDGGTTWLTNADGTTATFTAGDSSHKTTVNGVDIWFGQTADASQTATGNLSASDGFSVMAKSGVYWYRTTADKVNITPTDVTGDAGMKLSGGSLAGLLATRDQYIGDYRQQLDSLTAELVWQVNRLHSQGAGLAHHTTDTAENSVDDATQNLGSSNLAFADRLAAGNVSVALYDTDSGDTLGVTALDFSSTADGSAAFDPTKHSLNDVATAINASFSGKLTAAVSNGTLSITAADGVGYDIAADTSGLLAALGINTFFSGSDAGTIAVADTVANNTSRINAAQVDGSGTVSSGDNTVAQKLAALATTMLTTASSTTSQTLGKHLSTLVTQVGSDVDNAARLNTYFSTLATDADEKQQAVAGVNLDEELTTLIKYQQAYTAAAKLIQTANTMFDALMGIE